VAAEQQKQFSYRPRLLSKNHLGFHRGPIGSSSTQVTGLEIDQLRPPAPFPVCLGWTQSVAARWAGNTQPGSTKILTRKM